MSKPFNAESVSKANFDKDILEVTFVNQQGAKQIVNLSQAARYGLMVSLLARKPLPLGSKLLLTEPERILRVWKIELHENLAGIPLIELGLAKDMSVYLTFPKEGIKSFQQALASLERMITTPTQSH